MYEKLRKNIVAHNEKYVELNDLVHNAKTEQELQDAMTARWQFIHDYATWLGEFVWTNVTELTPADLSAFDLVPYIVWNKMSEKSERIVNLIMKLKGDA
jgi:hypothetical protein